MEALLYFMFWAGLIFLMMRFGCGAHVMGNGSRQQTNSNSGALSKWIPPDEDVDPVCDKVVATKSAKSNVYAGDVFYFCSRECREVFEAAPNLYVEKMRSENQELERTHV